MTDVDVGSSALLGGFLVRSFEAKILKLPDKIQQSPRFGHSRLIRVLATNDLTRLASRRQLPLKRRCPGAREKQTLQPNLKRRRIEHAAISCFAGSRWLLERIRPIADAMHLGLDLVELAQNFRFGAHSPNVKDEPRPQRARLVLGWIGHTELSNSFGVR